MIEIIAIIRPNKTSATKQALIDVGLPGYTCIKAFGRGKKPVDISLPDGTTISTKLMNKRVFLIVVPNESKEEVIKTILKVNSTGLPGDGKIFTINISDTYNIHHACHD
ncbi:MAG: P-II family nitrogen regulator [Thomasclavelia sp.]|jgi:nitrogen regulatory protein PII 2|nr:P-II family nitrogen regulator [Thomasclavelia sp.]